MDFRRYLRNVSGAMAGVTRAPAVYAGGRVTKSSPKLALKLTNDNVRLSLVSLVARQFDGR
jgi:hypothetical protein